MNTLLYISAPFSSPALRLVARPPQVGTRNSLASKDPNVVQSKSLRFPPPKESDQPRPLCPDLKLQPIPTNHSERRLQSGRARHGPRRSSRCSLPLRLC